LFCIVLGLKARINIFEHFYEGAKDGIIALWRILPTIIGIFVAMALVRNGILWGVYSRYDRPCSQSTWRLEGAGATGLDAAVFRLRIPCYPDKTPWGTRSRFADWSQRIHVHGQHRNCVLRRSDLPGLSTDQKKQAYFYSSFSCAVLGPYRKQPYMESSVIT
ncbi:MAG TPA: hypothetical protein PLQ98_10265, partial [Bacillota bacterium]|nr:hypothetical protein [Bacillota bacterium]